jgi:hypothetical protein
MEYASSMGSCLDISAPTLQYDYKLPSRGNAQGPQGLPYDFTRRPPTGRWENRADDSKSVQQVYEQIASAKHSLKFKHSLEAMPFLLPASTRPLLHQRLTASENKTRFAKRRSDPVKVVILLVPVSSKRRMVFLVAIQYKLELVYNSEQDGRADMNCQSFRQSMPEVPAVGRFSNSAILRHGKSLITSPLP